ncbi:MAG: LysM peptidoglycan-binding domain-containing protein [bacterium]|nr:LysM peptidoglycan-binding domain-containing protein [bacterium]
MKTMHSYLLFSFLALLALLCSSCAKDTGRSDIALEMTDEDSVEAIIDQDLLASGSTAIDVTETAGKNTSDVAVAYVDEVDLQKPVLVETDETLKGDAARGTGTAPGTADTMTPPLAEGAIAGADLPDTTGSGAATPDPDLARLNEEARSPALPATGMALESAQKYAPGSTTDPVAVRPPGSGYAASYYRTDQLPANYPRHTVQRGDSLWSVSKKYGCSISELAAANGISRGSILNVGQSLLVPVSKSPAATPAASTAGTTGVTTPGAAPATELQPAGATPEQPAPTAATAGAATTAPPPRAGSYETEYYSVQQGDSYWKIARQHGVTSTELMSLNDTSDSHLKLGQKILVPKKK